MINLDTTKRNTLVKLNIAPARPIKLMNGTLHEAGQTYRFLGAFNGSLARLSRVSDCAKIIVLPQDVCLA